MHHKLERVSWALLDTNLLKELHKKRKKKVVFMHAGGEHLKVMASILPQIKFNLKSSLSTGKNKGLEILAAAEMTSQSFSDIARSQELEQDAVDVKSFLKQCKTLPTSK